MTINTHRLEAARALALPICAALLSGCLTNPATCSENDAGVVICNGLPRPTGSGAGTILTFTNGGTPVSQMSGTTAELNNVAFGGSGNGLFVAVGAAGAIVTSPDGAHWTVQASPTPLDLFRVTSQQPVHRRGWK